MRTKLLESLYPGSTTLKIFPIDGSLVFYDRVLSLCRDGMTVVDYGASDGHAIKGATECRKNLLLLRPNSVRRIGVDVDPMVKTNPFIDEAHVLEAASDFRMPLADGSVDIVISDWVVEHLPSPEKTFQDIFRVLKPGGWFCARTVNIRHYAFIIARLLKDSKIERRMLDLAQGDRDTWKKEYLANTPYLLRSLAGKAGFKEMVLIPWEPEPSYLLRNSLTLLVGAAWQRLASAGLLPKATLLLFAQKGN